MVTLLFDRFSNIFANGLLARLAPTSLPLSLLRVQPTSPTKKEKKKKNGIMAMNQFIQDVVQLRMLNKLDCKIDWRSFLA